MRKWTEDERRKQSELLRRVKPWEKSTGPRTAAGKMRCRDNGMKHGFRSRHYRELSAILRWQRQCVRNYLAGMPLPGLYHARGAGSKGTSVVARDSVGADRVQMFGRGVSGVAVPAIMGAFNMQFCHQSVAGDLGKDRRRRDRFGKPVSADDRMGNTGNGGREFSVDERDHITLPPVRRGQGEGHYMGKSLHHRFERPLHRQQSRVMNIDLVNFLRRRHADPERRMFADQVVQRLPLLLGNFFAVVDFLPEFQLARLGKYKHAGRRYRPRQRRPPGLVDAANERAMRILNHERGSFPQNGGFPHAAILARVAENAKRAVVLRLGRRAMQYACMRTFRSMLFWGCIHRAYYEFFIFCYFCAQIVKFIDAVIMSDALHDDVGAQVF